MEGVYLAQRFSQRIRVPGVSPEALFCCTLFWLVGWRPLRLVNFVCNIRGFVSRVFFYGVACTSLYQRFRWYRISKCCCNYSHSLEGRKKKKEKDHRFRMFSPQLSVLLFCKLFLVGDIYIQLYKYISFESNATLNPWK